MTRKMIVNAVDQDEVRIAVVNDGKLEEFDIEARGTERNKGNIYLATVVAVEPALNAAFVSYGAEKQGFLTAHDVDPKINALEEQSDRPYRIDELLKPKQKILVQITKDEVSTKGAVLTTFLSLAGRYVVLIPESRRQAVSRRIQDDEARTQLLEAASMLDVPEGMGVIIRTAGKDRSRTELNRDLKVLLQLWENIQKESEQAKAPALIFKEQDVIIRSLRDYFTADTDEIILDSDEAYDRAEEYMHMVMPKQRSVLTRYVERRPIFHHYKVEDQLELLYVPKVTLPSGGSLVIQSTEALVAIDVNSGKQKSGDQEETATQTNMEAAREIARQLRLRDLGGIVVIDFIDMNSRSNQQRVEKVMRDTLSTDKARIKVGRISPNGTLEVTRQRIRTALQTSVSDTCSACEGTGRVQSATSHVVSVLRRLRDRAARCDLKEAKVRIGAEAGELLRTEKWNAIRELETAYNLHVEIVIDRTMVPGADDFTFETDPNAVVMPLEEPNFGPAPRPEGDEVFPEDHVDDDADEEKESDMETETSSTNKNPRRRRRRRNGERSTASSATQSAALGNDGMDLPSFELIDVPRNLNKKDASRDKPRTSRHGSAERNSERGAERGMDRNARGGQRPSHQTARSPERSGGRERDRRPRHQSQGASAQRRAPTSLAKKSSFFQMLRNFFAKLFG